LLSAIWNRKVPIARERVDRLQHESSRPAFCPWVRAPAALSNWREVRFQQPDHYFGLGGRRRMHCGIRNCASTQSSTNRWRGRGDEAGALDADAGAARIPALRAIPVMTRLGSSRSTVAASPHQPGDQLGGMSLKVIACRNATAMWSVVFPANAARVWIAGRLHGRSRTNLRIRFDATTNAGSG